MSAKRDVEYYRQKYKEGWDSDNSTHNKDCNCKLCILVMDGLENRNSLFKDIEKGELTTKKHSKVQKEPKTIIWRFIKTKQRLTSIDLAQEFSLTQAQSASTLCRFVRSGHLSKVASDGSLSKGGGRPITIYEVSK